MVTSTFLIVATVLGLIFGSFANVVILRDRRRATILTGRSECPHCKHVLQWYELIPLFSFVIQGGRCRSCHTRISIQYPLVEAAMGALFYLAALQSGGNLAIALLLAIGFFFFLVVSVIDIRTQMIPIEYALLGGLSGAAASYIHGVTVQNLFLGLVLAAGSLAVIKYGWLLLTKTDGMGEGDLWLAGALGLWLGYPVVIVSLVAAVLLGALLGIIITGIQRGTLKTTIPFGPFLFCGALIALIWGPALINWYLSLSGITL